jgi:hypothetical protein
VTVRPQIDVLGLDVPVDDADPVDAGEPVQYAHHELDRDRVGQPARHRKQVLA